MNIQRWKGIVWLASLGVGGFLVFYVFDFLKHKTELAQAISVDELAHVLDSVKKPAEQKTDVVEYAYVQKVFHDQDWTGKERAIVVAPTPGGAPQPTPRVPVSSLLKVLAIKVDTSKPDRSVAYVKFVDPRLDVHKEKEDTILKAGERLFPPYHDVRVEDITSKGVVFAFDDPLRQQETVGTSAYTSQHGELGIVQVGPEGAILPKLQKRIGVNADVQSFKPEKLVQIRKNEFQIGTETLDDLDRDYSRIISRDVSYSGYKNPKTGASEGIKINRVAPNSIPAQAGLTEGEVLKSINGHKVTSVNDAIAFVKANANTTDIWTAVFEKQGREFTRTYHSPDQ